MKPVKRNKRRTYYNQNQRYLILSGDGGCDSPGHNAKCLNYFLYDQDSKKILATSLTQLTEVGECSNQMEKAGLIKVLEEVKGKHLKIKSLATNSHCQIKKYMREEEKISTISLMYSIFANQSR